MSWNPPTDNGAVPDLEGVFSTTTKATVGFGGTKRRTEQKVYFYVKSMGEDFVSIQPLNPNFVPSGESRRIPREDLLRDYLPEPDIFHNKTRPAMLELDKHIKTGEEHYEKGQTFSAEYEFKSALRIDETNIRATFGLGLTYLDREEEDRAKIVFRRLVQLEGAFEERHKHLFNEFGIRLRKNKMYEEALKYYGRAAQISTKDDHLFYNIARTHFEAGQFEESSVYVGKALSLNPKLIEAKQLRTVLVKAARLTGQTLTPQRAERKKPNYVDPTPVASRAKKKKKQQEPVDPLSRFEREAIDPFASFADAAVTPPPVQNETDASATTKDQPSKPSKAGAEDASGDEAKNKAEGGADHLEFLYGT